MPKRYAQFASDSKKHGPNVAHFNDGFLKGWDNGHAKGFMRACQLFTSAIEGKRRPLTWSDKERRLFGRAMRKPRKPRKRSKR